MVRKLALVLVLLMIFPLVSAIETPISVKTLGDHKASIFVYSNGGLAILESYHVETGFDGMVSVKHSSGSSDLDVRVKVTNEGKTILNEKFEDYAAGEPISIRLDFEEITGTYDPTLDVEVNETVEQNGTVEEVEPNVTIGEIEEASGSITGNVVSENGGSISKIWYLIIVGILSAIAVTLFILRKSVMKNPAVIKSGANEKNVKISENEVKLIEVNKLEEKIKDFQVEINRLKNKEKIEAAEKRLEEDKNELERLRKG
jgi:uncharacterized small protein (DUF1192 family)